MVSPSLLLSAVTYSAFSTCWEPGNGHALIRLSPSGLDNGYQIKESRFEVQNAITRRKKSCTLIFSEFNFNLWRLLSIIWTQDFFFNVFTLFMVCGSLFPGNSVMPFVGITSTRRLTGWVSVSKGYAACTTCLADWLTDWQEFVACLHAYGRTYVLLRRNWPRNCFLLFHHTTLKPSC